MQVMVNKLDKSFAERDSRRNFKRFSILRVTCMIHNGAIQTFFGATMRRIFLFFLLKIDNFYCGFSLTSYFWIIASETSQEKLTKKVLR